MKVRLSSLRSEFVDACTRRFEVDLGVVTGDRVRTENGKEYFYDSLEIGFGTIFVVCHPPKKDGTPSKSKVHLGLSAFGFDDVIL